MVGAPLPPGPRGHFLTGHVPEFRRDSLGFVTRCVREYGDVVALRLGPKRVFLLHHPDAVEEVLVRASQNFTKDFSLRRYGVVLGNGLLTSEGDFWLRQRRIAQAAFLRSRIAAYGAVMVASAERLLTTWKDGETRDLHAEMMRLTLEIAAKTLFDADVASEVQWVGAALETALQIIDARFTSLFWFPDWIPTPNNVRLRRAVRQLDEILYRIIDQRRRSTEDHGDLLSLLLRARDAEDGRGMTDQQLRDEAMTLLLAGHETTALALTWTIYLLTQHPEIEAKLLAELQAVLGGRPPTVTDLPRLRYTESVVLEALRLYPPAYAMGRQAIAECEIHGYRVPAGTTLFMLQWVLHRDPRHFDNPEKFSPERWADGLAQRLPRFAYFPFGGGPRLCIGNAFAMMEGILVLATLAQKFRCTLVPGQVVTLWPSITLRPRHGIQVVLTRR